MERYNGKGTVGRLTKPEALSADAKAERDYRASKEPLVATDESVVICSTCNIALYCLHLRGMAKAEINLKVNQLHRVNEDGSCSFKPFETIDLIPRLAEKFESDARVRLPVGEIR